MDHYQYLILMMGCLAVTAPLELFGARAYRQPARLARAVLPVAAVFLAWDAIAITAGTWTYNPRYVTGVRLPLRVPVEELAFFLVVPICAILAYGCVQALGARRRGWAGARTGGCPRTRGRREPEGASR